MGGNFFCNVPSRYTLVLFWLDQDFGLHRNRLESCFPWSSGIFPASYSSVLSALHFPLNETVQLINCGYSTKPKLQQAAILSLDLDWGAWVIQIQFNSQKVGHLECTLIFSKLFSFLCFPSFSSHLFSPQEWMSIIQLYCHFSSFLIGT